MCLAKFSRALDGRSNYGIKYLSLMLLQRVMPLNFTSLQIQVDKCDRYGSDKRLKQESQKAIDRIVVVAYSNTYRNAENNLVRLKCSVHNEESSLTRNILYLMDNISKNVG